MRKYIIALCIIIAGLMLPTYAMAAFNEVGVYYEDEILKVRGTLDASTADVSVLVYDAEEYSSGASLLDALYIGQCTPVEGTFEESLPLGEGWTAGTYTLVLISSGVENYVFTFDVADVEGYATEDIQILYSEPLGVFTDFDDVSMTLLYKNSSAQTQNGSITIEDYYGSLVYTESLSVASGVLSKELVPDSLKLGHYTVTINIGEKNLISYFAVVSASPVQSGLIGADIALTYTDLNYDSYIRAARLAGIGTVRERMGWTNIQKGDNEYDYSSYDNLIDSYYENGIEVEALITAVPKEYRSDKDILPQELELTYDFFYSMGSHYDGKITAYELFNEPEDSVSADRYSSHFKAASAGLKDSGSTAKISSAGLAFVGSTPFANLLLRNDILDYADIFNIHNHISESTDTLEHYNAYKQEQVVNRLEAYGFDKRELWVSEAGIAIVPEDGIDLSKAQQITSARYVPVSALESISTGTDKHMWFLLRYYYENGSVYSTFTKNEEPYAAYSALAALTSAIGNMSYAGKITGTPEGVYAYGFEDEAGSMIALYADESTEIELRLGDDSAMLYDIMGNPSTITSDKGVFRINAGPDTVYLKFDSTIPELMCDKLAQSPTERAELTDANKVIMFQDMDSTVLYKANEDYELTASSANVTLTLYNTNSATVSGSVGAYTYGGFKVTPPSTDITLQAGETAELTFSIDAQNAEGGVSVPLVFEGEFGGDVTRSVSLIRYGTKDIDVPMTGYDKLNNWTLANANAVCTKELAEGMLDFTYRFTGSSGNYWTTASFIPVEGSFADTDGFSYDVRVTTPEELKLYVSIETADGSTYWDNRKLFEAGDTPQTVNMSWADYTLRSAGSNPQSELDPAQIISITFGCTTADTEIAFAFGNIGAYRVSDNIYGSLDSVSVRDNVVVFNVTEGEVPMDVDSLRVKIDKGFYDYDVNAGGIPLTMLNGVYPITAYCTDYSGKAHVIEDNVEIEQQGLVIRSIEFYDDGGIIYTGRTSDNVTAKVTVYNGNDTAYTPVLFAVQRDEDSLVSVKHTSQSIESGCEGVLTLTAPAGLNELILVSSLDTITPIMKKIVRD